MIHILPTITRQTSYFQLKWLYTYMKIKFCRTGKLINVKQYDKAKRWKIKSPHK